MDNAHRLRGTHFFIDCDYPREIQEARKKLWPKFRECRQQNPRSKVKVVYPTKLIKDGKVVEDELPEWNHYIKQSRVTDSLQRINSNTSCKTKFREGEPIQQQMTQMEITQDDCMARETRPEMNTHSIESLLSNNSNTEMSPVFTTQSVEQPNVHYASGFPTGSVQINTVTTHEPRAVHRVSSLNRSRRRPDSASQ